MWDGYEIVKRWNSKQGYVGVVVREIATGKIIRTKEHRWVAGVKPGEPVEVHHDNDVKDDNRPENLVVTTGAEHRRMHPENSAAGGRVGGARVRKLCQTDPEFRERQAEAGRQSRESWRKKCEADPSLRELNSVWSRKAASMIKNRRVVPVEHVERICALHASGRSPGEIARQLTSEGIPTPRGQSMSWGRSTVYKVINDRRS
jgi:hypothetical protein